MLLLLPLLMLAAAVLIGFYGFADDRGEESLMLKLVGYGILGFFTLTINRGVPIPIGFPIALFLASRVDLNRGARQAAATTTFLLFLGGLLMR